MAAVPCHYNRLGEGLSGMVVHNCSHVHVVNIVNRGAISDLSEESVIETKPTVLSTGRAHIGGTKTRCLIGDLNGNILGDYTLGASNHQTIGKAQAKAIISEVYIKALEKANITHEDIEYVYLGLSGADLPSDFELLNELCDEIFRGASFQIVNDAWISIRSGLKGKWGAVSICGTGFIFQVLCMLGIVVSKRKNLPL